MTIPQALMSLLQPTMPTYGQQDYSCFRNPPFAKKLRVMRQLSFHMTISQLSQSKEHIV